MKNTTNPPPVNGGSSRGEPFDRRDTLLEAYADAKRAEMAAQVDGDPDAIRDAGWAVADALGELDSHSHHQAYTLMLMLRDALATCPDALADVLSQVAVVQEHAGAIKRLTDEIKEHADAIAALEDRKGVPA